MLMELSIDVDFAVTRFTEIEITVFLIMEEGKQAVEQAMNWESKSSFPKPPLKLNNFTLGQADVDCIGNALCCFDGCANVCQGAGTIHSLLPWVSLYTLVLYAPRGTSVSLCTHVLYVSRGTSVSLYTLVLYALRGTWVSL